MPPLRLPYELLCCIAENLESERDINAFAQANWHLYSLLNPYLYRYNTQHSESSALSWAAKNGQEATAQMSLEKMADDWDKSEDWEPLVVAARSGHRGIVKLLLDKGFPAEGGLEQDGSALQAASYIGDEAIVRLLLDNGADVNRPASQDYGKALQVASFQGYEAIVKLLIEKGANIHAFGGGNYDAPGGECNNALEAALCGGHEAIAKLLLDKGADVHLVGERKGITLRMASERGYQTVVERLINNDADVNAQDEDHSNALHAASRGGYEAIVKLLLEKGADVNTQGGNWGNALQSALSGGHEAIAKLLLEKGADVNAQGGHYGNALQAASSIGSEPIVKMLLRKGADINAQSKSYGNALHEASFRGHMTVVNLLIDNGANINAQGGNYSNALQAASRGGHEAIAKLLLEKGADVNAQSGEHDNNNALSHEAIMEPADNNVDVDAQGGHYGNALQAASRGGHEATVKLLLEKGANVNAQGGYFGNPFHAAVYGGHMQVFELLRRQSNTSLTPLYDRYGRTLLWWAAAGGHIATVKALVTQYNFNPQKPNKLGQTPLYIALKQKHIAVSEFLNEGRGRIHVQPRSEYYGYSIAAICNVCTSDIQMRSVYYHCGYCAGGNWDMCADCKKRGAFCEDATHSVAARRRDWGKTVKLY